LPRLVPLLAVLVTALAATFGLQGPDSSAAQDGKGALSPELAWVPPDTAVLIHLRVADLFDSEPMKVLRQHLPGRVGALERELLREVGLKAAETESLTIALPSLRYLEFFLADTIGPAGAGEAAPVKIEPKKVETKEATKKPDGPPPARSRGKVSGPLPYFQPNVAVGLRNERPVMVVTTTKPATLDNVRRMMARNAKEHAVKGKTYFTNANDPGEAIHFLGERSFVWGPTRVIKEGLEKPLPARAAGPLAPALDKVMAKHHLVAGLQLTREQAMEFLNRLTPEQGIQRALRPLAELRSGVLTVDLGKRSRGTLDLVFPDEKRAERALPAVQDALTLLRLNVLGKVIAQAEEEMADATGAEEEKAMFWVLSLEQLEGVLGTGRAQHKGSAVHVAFEGATDLAAVWAKTKDVLREREGDAEVRLARLRKRSERNLKEIGIALHNFHDTYRQLPPAAILDKNGKPMLSWRVLILPFIEQEALYRQFRLNEPWDSPHNKKLLEKMPKIYAPVGVKTKEPHATFYQAITGPDAAWPTVRNQNHPWGASGARFPASFQDGTSNTIWLVEAGEAVPWTKPDDVPYDAKKALPRFGGLFKEGFHVGFADGSVRFIRRVDDVTLRALITPRGAEVVDFDKIR
jgi:hypothetical protein